MRIICLLLVATCSQISMAQRAELLSPGAAMPDVQAYDETGRQFSLTELKGEYTVLVFGCLT